MTPLLTGSALYLLSNILNAAIPFALLPVLTRYLSPAQYGEVAMFQTLLGGLAAFVGVGIAAAATRKHYDNTGGAETGREFVAVCLQFLLATSAIALLSVGGLREPLARFLGLDPQWILWAVLVTGAGVVVQIRLAEWQVRGQAVRYGALQVGQSLANLLLSLLLVVALHQGADGRIAAHSAATALFALLALILLRRDGLASFFIWRPALLKEAISYGIPMIPHVLAAFVLFAVDRLVINAELGLAGAGIYMVAAQLASGLSLVFDAAGRAYTPWLFQYLKRDLPAEKRQVVRATYAWFLLILAGAALVFVTGPSLVLLVAGAQYVEAGTVIGWVVLGQAFLGMYLFISNYLMYAKRTGLLSLVTVVSALVYIALLLLLVRPFGMQGAAISFASAMGLRLVLTWWAAHKSHPMPWLNFRVCG